MRKKIGLLLATFALVVCMPFSAFAAGAFDGGSTQSNLPAKEHNAGNMFAFGSSVMNVDVENDLYWFGSVLDASKLDIGATGHGSIIAAGQSVSLKNTKVADSLRIAANDIEITHTEVGNNVTIAARSINIGNEMKANGIYAAAQTLAISGSYKGGALTGETVSFDGQVEGDLSISAGTITIGKNAQVKGQLELSGGSNIEIAEGADVPNVVYSEPVQSGEPTLFDNLVSILYACMAHVVLVGLFFVIIRKSLVDAANMVKPKFWKMILAGAVVFLVAPIVCLLLIFPLVTIPVVVLMAIVMLVIALFSIPFTGSALGMALLGKKMNPVLAAIIGTVVLTILAYLPVISAIAVIFSIIFTAGYLWMRYWEIHQQRKQERLAARQAAFAQQNAAPVPPAPQPPAPPAPGTQAPSAPVNPVPPAPTGDPVAPAPPAAEPPAPTGSPADTGTAPAQPGQPAQPAAGEGDATQTSSSQDTQR